jgi:hypothetical protein
VELILEYLNDTIGEKLDSIIHMFKNQELNHFPIVPPTTHAQRQQLQQQLDLISASTCSGSVSSPSQAPVPDPSVLASSAPAGFDIAFSQVSP